MERVWDSVMFRVWLWLMRMCCVVSQEDPWRTPVGFTQSAFGLGSTESWSLSWWHGALVLTAVASEPACHGTFDLASQPREQQVRLKSTELN